MDFTYHNYKKLLTTLAADYEFIPFSRAKYASERVERKVLLRHDIDQSIDKAEKMAKIESDLGISSTFFLFLKSPFYNIFSHQEELQIRKIIDHNHYIGLHFDYTKASFKTISQISYQIKKEAEFLENYFNIKLDAVSFHRPFSLDFFNKLELSLYPHTYEKIFVENFKYFSDSRGRWRFGHPLESNEYQQRNNLHLLIHPLWWNPGKTDRLKTIEQFKKTKREALNNSLYSEMKGLWDEINKE